MNPYKETVSNGKIASTYLKNIVGVSSSDCLYGSYIKLKRPSCLFCKMKFQLVYDLVPGTRYKIVYYLGKVQTGTYIGTDRFGNRFDRVLCENNKRDNQYLPECLNEFYKPVFQKNKIQSDMEHRALQLILKSIIGDQSFSW